MRLIGRIRPIRPIARIEVDRPTARCQPTADLWPISPKAPVVNAVAFQLQPASDSREQPISRYELWAVVAIVLLGAAVRFAFPSAMAVEHFDEGVYASNLLFTEQEGFRYPDRHLYAPSLVPWLIEWSIIFFGDKGIAPMLPSLLFGTLTIPLIWWVGRQWFGPLSGIAAATLLSLSDFHIAFSRSALTDVPLCFWLLLAVYLFERSFRDLSWSAAIWAGVTTGLAWWTKYNGWLPLAISLCGMTAWLVTGCRHPRQRKFGFALWGIGFAGALLTWAPYCWSLPHGYSEVARNHRGYIVGLSGWWESLQRHCETLHHCYAGRLQLLGVLLVPVVCWPAIFRRIRSGGWGDDLELPSAWSLGAWLTTAWWFGLSVSAPFYRPYPRLLMPWLIASCLVASLAIGFGFHWNRLRQRHRTNGNAASSSRDRPRVTVQVVLIGLLVVLIVGLAEGFRRSAPEWENRRGLKRIAANLRTDVLDSTHSAQQSQMGRDTAVIYVYAEPGLFFHLPAEGLAVQPAGNLNFVDIEATRRLPTFLVTGPHAHRSNVFTDEFAKRADRFELITRYPYDASDFVRLDDVSATQLRVHREPLEVRLYRVLIPE